ncbi:TNF receptor-associated factor-like protein [Cardamine amara subsp. amara]|uniref:TNF receptor-associated factor-like protein n=1 Tax=Cardamine amara subsp. amara TaxID=228776 RepID=A0ABD0Z9N5_CARAN
MSEITNENSEAERITKDRPNDEDDDCGSNPSELYGTYTWKIEEFSKLTQELYSNVFEVGGHKWSILMFPQGCDVSNHLSLFLCVANHNKLLTGWSHLAQFTIGVLTEDPTKSKRSDALHRFWEKEHDWGWKKFMELPRLQERFIDHSDSLIIKAHVQVIRESVDRPFCCLDSQYRKEDLKIYLKTVEHIFLTYMEEKIIKFARLVEDKNRWKSLRAFWLGMDQNSRLEMSQEKMDVILKLVVEHFFIDKEITSPLAMDFLFYGLKSLEEQKSTIIDEISKLVLKHFFIHKQVPSTLMKDSLYKEVKTLEDETKNNRVIDPIVSVENDMFALCDDAMLLIKRFVLKPLREYVPQNRMQVGNVGERDEKRVTEFGRQILEVLVLDHIFGNKIEVVYNEATALKRQEEFIREEEE